MVDNFSLLVAHGLLMLTAWRLLWRVDLDDESPDAGKAPFWGRKREHDADA